MGERTSSSARRVRASSTFCASWERLQAASAMCFLLRRMTGMGEVWVWVGNWAEESGPGIPTKFRLYGLDHGSEGGPQWRLGRLLAYEAFVQARHPEIMHAGMTQAQIDAAYWPWYGNMALQVEYDCLETKTKYPEVHAALIRGGDIDALTRLVCDKFEIPAKATEHMEIRLEQAHLVFDALKDVVPPSASTAANAAAIKAKKEVKTSNGNAGLGTVVAAGVGALHWFAGMPGNMAAWAAAAAGLVILMSLWMAQKYAMAAAQAAQDANRVAGPHIPAPGAPVAVPVLPQAVPVPAERIPVEWVLRGDKYEIGDPPPVPPKPVAPPPPELPLELVALANQIAAKVMQDLMSEKEAA